MIPDRKLEPDFSAAERDSRWDAVNAAGSVPALIVVDVQHDFAAEESLAQFGVEPGARALVADAVSQINVLVDEARRLGVAVIWVELGCDPAEPWAASDWLRNIDAETDDWTTMQPCVSDSPGAQWFHVTPLDGEIRIVKRGYSGFFGTDLAVQLRALTTSWVAVCGLTTECCVFATAQDALQHGWPVVVATDAVAAYDDQLHTSALRLLELNVALLSDVAEVSAAWKHRAKVTGAA